MKQELTIIAQQEVLGRNFTVYGDFENPLFLAKDVANWIEHSNVTTMLEKVDSEEKTLYIVPKQCLGTNSSGRGGLREDMELWFLTEDGLYEVLMQSRKPIAKAFKKEVKAILKTIRKHGAYITAPKIEELLNDPDTMIRLLLDLKEERNKNQDLEELNLNLAMENMAMQPKVNYVDTILNSNCCMTTTQIAADYGISAKKLNEILHEERVQRKVSKQWVLYINYMNSNLTKSETFFVNEGKKLVVQTKWTQRGRILIHHILIARGFEPL